MSENVRIADQLHKAIAGGAWHGPALAELLADVDESEAAARPIAGAHTIWELAEHAAAWSSIVRRRLAGERLDDSNLTAADDWPPVRDPSAAAWAATRRRVEEEHEKLRAAIVADTGALEREGVYAMLHGLVQHTIYHAGQIALLKKALREG